MRSRYLSHLDLMCCGFGGALLMFLIVATARDKVEPAEPMLVVRCHAKSEPGRPQSGAELGIEYRRLGAREWIRANGPPQPNDDLVGTAPDGQPGARWMFLPRSAPNQPAEALLICRYPRTGRWEFRAYLADFPAVETEGEAKIPVVFQVLGAAAVQSPPALLATPGSSTASVVVEIRPNR